MRPGAAPGAKAELPVCAKAAVLECAPRAVQHAAETAVLQRAAAGVLKCATADAEGGVHNHPEGAVWTGNAQTGMYSFNAL